jgi:hypothetical protein
VVNIEIDPSGLTTKIIVHPCYRMPKLRKWNSLAHYENLVCSALPICPQGEIKQINSTQVIRAYEPGYESYVGCGNIEAGSCRFGTTWRGMFTLRLRPLF